MAANITELILDRAPTPVTATDVHGTVTYWNPAAEATFGHARAAAMGQSLAELMIAPSDRAEHRRALAQLFGDAPPSADEAPIDVNAIGADGGVFRVRMTLVGVQDAGRQTVYTFFGDSGRHTAGAAEQARLVGELRRALHGSERRFDAIVGALSDAVTIRDRDHRFVYANRAGLRHLGLDSLEQLRQTSPDRVMADYRVFGEDGHAVTMNEIPSVRILRGEAAEPLVIQSVHRQTGERRWDLLKSAPLLDDQGAVEATIMIIEDVTEQKRTERQAAFLAEAGTVLASSLDYEQTLRNVAQLAVPGIADWCAVDLVDEQGDRVPVAVAHVDPSRLELAEKLRSYEPEHPEPERGLGLVFRTGEPLLYNQITAELLEQTAVDEEHLELLRALEFSSVMIVPIRLRDRILGAMTLVGAESGRVLDEFDLQLAEQVAARAAVAIENSRLYSERSLVAHTLQQSLLPEELPQIPGYELASIYVPAVASTEVGGDFYDAWPAADSWMIAIGDVTGKGVKAAALTALVRHTLRAASDFETSPAQLLTHADRALKKQRALSICTALVVRLQDGRVTISAGGHPLPLHLSSGDVRQIGQAGPLLGGFEGVCWQDLTFELPRGSTLVTYTDGVTDAVGSDGSRYGQSRLQATLAQSPTASAGSVIAMLTRALDAFQTARHADDTAVLAVHRLP